MMTAHQSLASPACRGAAPQTGDTLGKAVAGIVAVGVLMGALLWESGSSWNHRHQNGHISKAMRAAHTPLDLSKPIFVKGALCPYNGLLASFSDVNSQGCLVADDTKPVMVVAIASNGLQDQVFKVDMDTAEGSVEGWVASSSLRN